MGFPDWVEKHRKPGVELRHQRGKYYAHRVTSRYDPKVKRSRKVTLEYLGAITEKGLEKPKHKLPPRFRGRYDAGNVAFPDPFVAPLRRVVEASFPDDWQNLIAAAALKLLYVEPGSRLQLRHETSLASKRWPQATGTGRCRPQRAAQALWGTQSRYGNWFAAQTAAGITCRGSTGS